MVKKIKGGEKAFHSSNYDSKCYLEAKEGVQPSVK